MDSEKQKRKVIHLQIGSEHIYYGSVKCLLKENSCQDLGFSESYIKNNIGKLGILQNDKCIIRQGILRTQEGKRGEKFKK